MALFHETILANASHQDGVLSFSSSDFDVLVALRRWDMPFEAYPKTSPFAQSCGVSTSYKLRFCTEAGFYVVGGDITVHLLMQAFVIPGGNADYYSFWNAKDFPGHDLDMPCNNACGYFKGRNHASATLAWQHAKDVFRKQYEVGPMPLLVIGPTWCKQVSKLWCKQVNDASLPKRSASADTSIGYQKTQVKLHMKRQQNKIKNMKMLQRWKDAMTMDGVEMDVQQQIINRHQLALHDQSSQASASSTDQVALHDQSSQAATASADQVALKDIIADQDAKLWHSRQVALEDIIADQLFQKQLAELFL